MFGVFAIRRKSVFAQLLIGAFMLVVCNQARAAEPFEDKVLPFLNTYCVRCHNDKEKKGELDLKRFTSAEKIFEDFRQWKHVLTFLRKEEMPPAKAKQPTAELRAEVLATLEKMLLTEARKYSGDPGVVPPRRLSNAAYDYTIRDLTGVDIRPAKSFPIDPASGEGFNNTGEALTMSPALFKKYYTAGELVADHALLTSTGLSFAPHAAVTFADRQKFYEQAIIRFYESHAVDYEKYFTSLWQFKHKIPALKPPTIEEWAKVAGLSPKYLRSLWEAVEGDSADKFLIAWLRQRWNALPAPKNEMAPFVHPELQTAVRALAADIQQLSQQLCPKETPAIVADAGNGPITHLACRGITAESRDAFDKAATLNQQQTLEFKNVTDKASIKLVIQLADLNDTKAEGTVFLNGIFFTNNLTTDNKNKWPLRAVLAEHAPDQLKKLKTEGESLVLTAPTMVELEIPTKAFLLKGKGNVTFTVDCRLNKSTTGLALVRLLDHSPVANDAATLGSPLIDPKHPAATQFATSGEAFCKLFPNRFFYVDSARGLSAGFHLIEGFFRDDRPLYRSVLSDSERHELDLLWFELYFVTGIWEKMLRGFVFFERSERNLLKHPDFDSFKEEDSELVKDETLARFKEAYLKRSNVKFTGDELATHPIRVFFEDVRAGLRRQAATVKKADRTRAFEDIRCLKCSPTSPAVAINHFVFCKILGDILRIPLLQLAERQELGTLQMAFIPLRLLANIEQHRLLGLHGLLNICWCVLGLVGGHGRSSYQQQNERPQAA